MAALSRAIDAGKLAKRALLRRLPAPVRLGARDVYHRTRLRFGNDPLGEPAQHEQFIAEHLGRLGVQPGTPLTYLEFGIYQGATLAAAVRGFDRAGFGRPARFFGFDSFEGLPPGSEAEGWGTGWYGTSRTTAEWNLRRLGVLDRVRLFEGWFEDTCTPDLAAEIGRAHVVMIDCDIYSATEFVVRFAAPLLSDPCLLIFDDWLSFNPDESPDYGQVRAFHEWQAREPGRTFERLPGIRGHHGVAFITRPGPGPEDTDLAEDTVVAERLTAVDPR